MSEPLFDNLEIRQFRAFDYIKIDQLGHINLFLGKNNVVKSTLLEALWLYANLGSPEVMRANLDGRDEPGRGAPREQANQPIGASSTSTRSGADLHFHKWTNRRGPTVA